MATTHGDLRSSASSLEPVLSEERRPKRGTSFVDRCRRRASDQLFETQVPPPPVGRPPPPLLVPASSGSPPLAPPLEPRPPARSKQQYVAGSHVESHGAPAWI